MTTKLVSETLLKLLKSRNPLSYSSFNEIAIFDTTLRDGCQGFGINFTYNDKIKIAKLLDNLGVHYIEGDRDLNRVCKNSSSYLPSPPFFFFIVTVFYFFIYFQSHNASYDLDVPLCKHGLIHRL